MDFFIELLLDVYMELMLWIIPSEHTTPQRARRRAVIVAFCVLFVVVGLFLGGVYIWTQESRVPQPVGIAMVAAGAVLSIIQIVAGIVLRIKNS